jgi:hypothetical protein
MRFERPTFSVGTVCRHPPESRKKAGHKYLNRAVPGRQPNPVPGRDFYVGGRWGEIDKIYAPADRSKTHFMCSAHLLFHGVSTFCR